MKIFLETYGCQMNKYDSELVRGILKKEGYQFGEEEEAEVVLLNTCAIRENAHRKVFGRLDDFRARPGKRKPIVAVLGCMAQNLKKDLFRHPAVDLVVGPDNYRELPLLIEQAAGGHSDLLSASLSEYETYADIAPERLAQVNGWIAVMRGCDNFCTFCVVPYTRGRERSREPEGVLNEGKGLAAAGFPQVTLLGQNVNSYRFEDWSFADLLGTVADIPGIRRVRFTSPHPKDFPSKLLDVVAEHPHICKQIHLPLQAGSDRVLALMNRTYTAAEYLKLAEEIRKRIPGVALSTDIIVGFPTETEEDFQKTCRIMEEVRFNSAYIFKYSERKGTIAARDLPDDVAAEAKTDRTVRLFELQKGVSLAYHRALIGSAVEVLVSGRAEKRDSHWVGKTDANSTVIFRGDVAPGAFVAVRVEDATASALYGSAL